MLEYFKNQRLLQIKKIFADDITEYSKEEKGFSVLTVRETINEVTIKQLDKKGLRIENIHQGSEGQKRLIIRSKPYDVKKAMIVILSSQVIIFSLIIMSLASKLHI